MNARVSAILAFRLTTQEPERLVRFYQKLGFARSGPVEIIPDDEIALMGLKCGGRRLPLRLGEQRVDLDSFDETGGRYPGNSTSANLRFQHLALVTDDASAAWAGARALGAQPISESGPVTLPSSAGGVTAVKFRDFEGHPLEFLQFPRDSRHGWKGTGLLGIDHSAISVSNARTSQTFYEALGLSVQAPMLNCGPTQEDLDGLAEVEVDVVPMMPRQPPHLELLAYRTTRTRACVPLKANDVAATRVVWAADRDAFVRDPDGHLHLMRRDHAVA